MSLNTHSSGAAAFDYSSGPGGEDLLIYESGGWMARRAVWWLIHGQVFERHPDLKLVITEQFEGWWTPTLHELDSVYVRFGMRGSVLPKMPSEYARRHVFMGASFLSPAFAEQAFREGFVDNVLWGRDYPHIEGAFQVAPAGAEPITHLSLRNSLSRVPRPAALAMAGENAVRAFGLDRAKLMDVAARINAPTVDALLTPPKTLPTIAERSNAFRGQAGARPLDVVLS
jgi:predicted TIM-barrel fold metal-dependent hydrolase